MYATHDESATVTRSHIETCLALANTVLASVEYLTALNLNTARALFEDGLAGSRAFFGTGTNHDVIVLQIAVAQAVFEKIVRYSGSTCEIALQGKGEVSRLITSQFLDVSLSAISGSQKVVKRVPANREAAPTVATAGSAAATPGRASARKNARKGADAAETAAVAIRAVAAPGARKTA